jgi:hypothetical protein
MVARRRLAVLLPACLLLSQVSFASETFTGKCVGVSDGDTIKVLRDGTRRAPQALTLTLPSPVRQAMGKGGETRS